MDTKSISALHDEIDRKIREDAAAHPERTYRQHVEAAECIAAKSYHQEIREGRA